RRDHGGERSLEHDSILTMLFACGIQPRAGNAKQGCRGCELPCRGPPPRLAAMDRTRFRLAVLALAVAGVTAPLSGARAEDGAAVARGLAAAGAQGWVAAEASARQSGALAVDLVTWQRLRAGQGGWAEYLDFARRNPDWPGMELLYRRGEAALPPDAAAAEVLQWFGERLPETVPAAQAWIAAQPRKGRDDAAVRFWTQPVALDE